MAQLRISDELMKKAEKQVKVTYRSAPKQIELWATIGEKIEAIMTPADIAALSAGELEVKVVRKKSAPIDMDSVFLDLEKERQDGSLKDKVLKGPLWYQESIEHPGYLEQIVAASGKRTIGTFEKGEFRPKKPSKKK